jgi:hypothetical protein
MDVVPDDRSFLPQLPRAIYLALAPAIEQHDSGTRDARTPGGLPRAKLTAKTRKNHAKNRRERHAYTDEEKTEIMDPATKKYRVTRLDEEEESQKASLKTMPLVPFRLGVAEMTTTMPLMLQTKQNH